MLWVSDVWGWTITSESSEPQRGPGASVSMLLGVLLHYA